MKKKILIILILLIAIGFLYRFYSLNTDSYWIDESYSVLAAKNIGEYGTPKFDSGTDYTRALPQSYALFVIGQIFGYSHTPMRILSVIAGTAFIALIFFIIKKQYNTGTALITAALTSFSYYQIAWSRQARMYIFLQFFFYLSLYLYYNFWKTHRLRHLIFTCISIIATFFFHKAAIVLPPIMFLHYIITLNRIKIKKFAKILRSVIKNKPVLITLSLLMIIIISYMLRHLHYINPSIGYFSSYRFFLFNSNYIFIFFGTIGFFSYKKYFSGNLLYAIAFGVLFIIISYLIRAINLRYSFILLPVIYIFSAQGIVYLTEISKNRYYKMIAALMIIAILISGGFFFMPKSSYALEPDTPQPPFRDAYDYLKTRISNNETLIVSQPGIAELYFRKADYWIAFSYSNSDPGSLYSNETNQEIYTGIQTISTADQLRKITENPGYLVIDDMGLARIKDKRREMIGNMSKIEQFGTDFWSRVYILEFGR